MAKSELTGIERHLILDYLRDGNIPLTLTPIEEKLPFPVALRGEQVRFLEPGIILIVNAAPMALSLAGKLVRVQFYFNKLGLFFISKIQLTSGGLALVIPEAIGKVVDVKNLDKSAFSFLIHYDSTDISCEFDEDFPLFSKSRREEVVQRYLSRKNPAQTESVAGRIHAPKVIYIDSETVVFAALKNDMPLSSGAEYAVRMSFPLSGPIKARFVSVSCIIDEMFESFDRDRLCACGFFSVISEEDKRFLADKIAPHVS
ncbi:MAG: hypothetical protein IJ257_07595 [Treponema sp.]|nr:hypothetical protein [Treponema sp.]